MRTLWAILFGGLALVGAAEARLGETKEECEKRYGALFPMPEQGLFADPEKFYGKIVKKDFNGLAVTLIFGKADNVCVGVTYIKMYKTPDEIEFTPEMVEDLLKRDYPDPNDLFVRASSEGLVDGKPAGKKWMASWKNERNNDTAVADSGSELEGEYKWGLTCVSKNYRDEMLNWMENKDKILEQREREKTQKAKEGL